MSKRYIINSGTIASNNYNDGNPNGTIYVNVNSDHKSYNKVVIKLSDIPYEENVNLIIEKFITDRGGFNVTSQLPASSSAYSSKIKSDQKI